MQPVLALGQLLRKALPEVRRWATETGLLGFFLVQPKKVLDLVRACIRELRRTPPDSFDTRAADQQKV